MAVIPFIAVISSLLVTAYSMFTENDIATGLVTLTVLVCRVRLTLAPYGRTISHFAVTSCEWFAFTVTSGVCPNPLQLAQLEVRHVYR